MNIKTLKIFVLPLLLAVTLGGIYLMPRKGEVQDSSISMALPTGMNPDGWHGTGCSALSSCARYGSRHTGRVQWRRRRWSEARAP